jgi:hypothetical protein
VIERQHGEVGGLPDQDWSLRVTLVYRRQGAEWWLVHRHADPLVRDVGLKTAAALARGTISTDGDILKSASCPAADKKCDGLVPVK